MAEATKALQFLIDDQGDNSEGTLSGFRKDFAEDAAYRSILQRNDKELTELLDMFRWEDDDDAWVSEYYSKKNSIEKMVRLRRRIAFMVTMWREIYDDLAQYDVSCLRNIRTPYVTSRTPLRILKREIDSGSGSEKGKKK